MSSFTRYIGMFYSIEPLSSVTSLGDFWNFLWTNFVKQEAQMLRDIIGLLLKMTL